MRFEDSSNVNGCSSHEAEDAATSSSDLVRTNGIKINGYSTKQVNSDETIQETFSRQPLPIDSVRRRLTNLVKNIDVAIFIGETGSGKSTQIPQMCLDAGLAEHGLICVTQPRKVAARSLAIRVATELGCKIGDLVGYKFRFEDHVGEATQLAYLTDGILLREALHDSLLTKYSVVIVDEAHERSVHTDVLLYILKLCQNGREKANLPPLKVFLMSATIQADKFSTYFNKAPIYYVKGRTHPVELFCANELLIADDDYLYNTISTVVRLHQSENLESGFLVFLTGQEEIDSACKIVEQAARELKHRIAAIPLYSSVSQAIQAKAFELPPHNHRKVVFATNIAETSVTIPGIRVVIDSGKIKQKSFTSSNRVDVLKVVNISKEQAIQRAGRAGREARGKCYRLYSQKDYESFVDVQRPEILRSNLSSVLLDLIKMGLRRMHNLKLVDPPPQEGVDAALMELKLLKAVDEDTKGRFSITRHGQDLVRFPVDPPHAKILVSAKSLHCLEEALTVVAFLAAESVFAAATGNGGDLLSRDALKEVGEVRAPRQNVFDAPEGDHVRLLKIYRAYRTQRRNNKNHLKEWCSSNGLHFGRMENVLRIRRQLLEICRDNNFVISSCGTDFTNLRKAICQGLFMNTCVYDRITGAYRLERRTGVTVKVHPSSCLARGSAVVPAFVFTDLVRTSELFARDVCLIDVDWLTDVRLLLKSKV